MNLGPTNRRTFSKNPSAVKLRLAISVAGEIGNNTFDHNLGQWRDVHVFWFECQVTGGRLWMVLADRGQGIFQSLAGVHPGITDEEEALKAAFEKVISGRGPEQRGNGIKFVRSWFQDPRSICNRVLESDRRTASRSISLNAQFYKNTCTPALHPYAPTSPELRFSVSAENFPKIRRKP
jgi:hypothetical protein